MRTLIILDRYLVREVAKPILIFFFVLTAIFAAYSASEFLGKAAGGLIRIDTIATLIFLKSVIAMEVLLPIATFLTVVVGLSRLGANYEITAMAFCGYSRLRVLRALSILFVAIAIAVGFLSIWARPRVYAETYRLLAEAKTRLNLNDVQEGVFLSQDNGKTVIFVDRKNEDIVGPQPRSVFVFLDRSDSRLVLMADQVKEVESPINGTSELVFTDLEVWQLEGSGDTMTVASEEIVIPFDTGQKQGARKRRKATATYELGRRDNAEDLSEYQWRISRPLSTLILGFLAVGLANFVPRRDRYARLFLAVVVYIVYFNLQALARGWVEHGVVPAIPGIFWVDGLVGFVLVTLFLRSRWRQGRKA